MTRDPRHRHRNLTDAARGYNEPPPAPRERMWERIDAARHGARPQRRARWWERRRVLLPAAAVLALAVGLTVGRSLGPTPDVPPHATVAHDGDGPVDPTAPPLADARDGYRLSARPVLARTEALLLQVRTDQEADAAGYGDRARDLLALTRLLLDSPAGRDAELAPLLRDLELALARLVQHGGDDAASDQKFRAFEDGLARKSVLPRLREQLNADPTPIAL